MKFRTEPELRTVERLLDPEKPIVLTGSCFTDYIGARMRSRSLWYYRMTTHSD